MKIKKAVFKIWGEGDLHFSGADPEGGVEGARPLLFGVKKNRKIDNFTLNKNRLSGEKSS